MRESMRRICHLVLACLVATSPFDAFAAKKKHKAPVSAAAEDEAREEERAQSETPHRRRRHKQSNTDTPPSTPTTGDTSSSGAGEPNAPSSNAPAAAAVDDDDGPNIIGELGEIDENPSRIGELFSKFVPPRRYPYVMGVVFAGIGIFSGIVARGQANVAQSPGGSAHQAQVSISEAQASASLANVMYGLAIAAVLTALVLEFLPDPAAEKASLTFHF